MFVYNASDVIGGVLVALLLLVFVYKICRYYFIRYKYRKCPCCGSETGIMNKTNYSFGDQDSYENIYCRGKYSKGDKSEVVTNCNWNYDLRF